jgi:hypothetical protein
MKRLTKQERKEKAVVDLVNQMFAIAGYKVTYEDIVGVDRWFQKYTMTFEQGEEFMRWGKQYLMRNLRMRAYRAQKEMMWFNVNWGLTYSDFENYYKGSNSTH